jgi:hypothetical protein
MKRLLGGPGPACSVTQIQRLAAGELEGAVRERIELHLAGCDRCQASSRALEEERRVLEAELPFQEFAAGVAEKLAKNESSHRRRTRWILSAVPVALAAGLAFVFFIPQLFQEDPLRRTGPVLKGGTRIIVHVPEGNGSRVLANKEPLPQGGSIRLTLSGATGKQVVIALVDADGVSILYAGRVPTGPIPGAFEWTGAGKASLVAVVSDDPVDSQLWATRLERHGVAGAVDPGDKVEVVARELWRSSP